MSDQYLDIDYTEGLTRFILNIGAHDTPPDVFNNDTIVVAVEPLPEVAARIPTMKNRYVLTAAVADYYGIATFHHWMVRGIHITLLYQHVSVLRFVNGFMRDLSEAALSISNLFLGASI